MVADNDYNAADLRKAFGVDRSPDHVVLNQLAELTANIITLRQELSRRTFDPRRNIADECGYPRTLGEITPEKLQDLYDFEAVPARVVEVLPKESWQVYPEVYESEDVSEVTPFEKAWNALEELLLGEDSSFKGEGGPLIWEYLLRADIQSGIGQYGIILLGIDDGLELSESAKLRGPKGTARKGTNGSTLSQESSRKLLYLRVFPESLAQISSFENDPRNPRFGKPLFYNVTFNDPRYQYSGIGLMHATKQVHWTRIVHLADNRGPSEVFGIPRMRPVLRRLLDLEKIYGADSEAYWKNAIMRIYLETHPQLGGDVQVNLTKLRDMMENMENGLQRWTFLSGMGAKTVAPAVVDPTPHINTQIEAICIKLGIPIRIFKGSERGELASSQDDAAWNDRLRERQHNYLTPCVIAPFVSRLIALNVLPVPLEGYNVKWPDLTSQTDGERADVMVKKTQAYAAYVSGGLEAVIPPLDYMTRFDDMDEEEAETILEAAMQAEEEKMVEQQEQAEEQGFEPVPPSGFIKPKPEQPPFPVKLREGERLVQPDGKPVKSNGVR